MKKLGRCLLLTTVAASVAGLPSLAAAGADVAGSVRSLAERAAELTVEEQMLLQSTADPDLDVTELASIEARLQTVDGQGAEILGQLDRLDVELTQAIRISLAELAPAAERYAQPDLNVPADAVYDAAAADLLRIVATPEAVTSTPSDSNTPALGLLAVASLSLLALGAAALGNSLRRKPDEDELSAMAWSDGLTGLANRRRLDADLERHDLTESPTAAIMVDVDHFKDINDTFGHAYGDEILRTVGETISAQVRYDDIVYRYGGEEFCVLLPGAADTDAGAIAGRIVHAIRSIALPDGRHVTVSVGVAGPVGGGATSAVRRADAALYSAKQQGRDQAISSDDRSLAV